MDVKQALPLIMAAIIAEICIQAYFIDHCWKNDRMTKKQKVLFTIVIIIFNIPAAAVYIFYWGRIRPLPGYKEDDVAVADAGNAGLRLGMFALLVFALLVLSLNIIITTESVRDRETVGYFILSAIILISLIDGPLVKRKHAVLYYLLPAALIISAVSVNYLFFNMSSKFIVLASVASLINNMRLRHAQIYSVCAFFLYIGSGVAKLTNMGVTDKNPLIGTLYTDIVIFVLLYAAFHSIKKQTLLNGMLRSALQELREKSSKLEEMGAIAERNRIAGEIHDNVGHMLTAAVVSIEAGEKLMRSDPDEATQKLKLAREQVMGGLQSIRMSVKAIREGQTEAGFALKVKTLLQQITHDTGLVIADIVETSSRLLPIQQNVILQSIVECATNSIKHGGSTQADLLIQEHKGLIRMTFSDNGRGSKAFSPGFGLNNMRERAESLGGSLQTESSPGEGFTVSLAIPVGEKGGNEA